MRRLLLVGLIACSHGDQYAMSIDDITMVRVADDGRVTQLTGGGPEMYLRGTRVVDSHDADVLACRDGKVFEGNQEIAQLRADGFAYLTTVVTLNHDGTATIRRPRDPDQTIRYTGTVDACTAALLFDLMPVPRAG